MIPVLLGCLLTGASVVLGRPSAVPGTDFLGSTVSVDYACDEDGAGLSATLTVGAKVYPGTVGLDRMAFEIPPADTVPGELYEGEISVDQGLVRVASAPVTILQGLPFRTWHGGWFGETAAAVGVTGAWSPVRPQTRGGMMEFDTEEVEGGVIDFVPETAEPDEAVTVIEATAIFERAIDEDEQPEGFQAGMRLVNVPDGAGGTKPSFAVLVSGGWQTAELADLTPVADEPYDVRIEICHTNVPRTVAYSVKVGGVYRQLFAGAAYLDRDRVTGVAVKGIGRIAEVTADYESVTGADPRLVESDGNAYTNVADALAAGCGSFRLRWPTTFVPTGAEGDYRIEGGELAMKARPAASETSGLATEGRVLHFDTTSGLETLATKSGERLVSWKSRLDDGWTAVPGPTYAGPMTLPPVLPRDCGGLPAVKLENFGLTDGQGYLLFQKDGVTREFNGMKSVFWVLGSQEGGGFLLGGGTNISLSTRYNFHRGGTNGTIGASAEQPILSHNPPTRVINASWRLNGEAVVPTKAGLSGGYDVISMALANANDAPVNADGFAFDGRILNTHLDFQAYARRCGHQRLCEVIAYDRILSLDERRQTEAYLQRKWGLLEGAAHSSVTLEAGVTLDVTGDGPRRFAALGGEGRIVGDAAVEALEGAFGKGPLVVAGTLTVSAEMAVRVSGVPEAQSRCWIPLVQAGAVEGLQPGSVRFEGVPAGKHAKLRCRNGVWGADVRDDGFLVALGSSGGRRTYRAVRVGDDEVAAALRSRPHAYRAEPVVERPERVSAADDAVLVYAADNLTDSYPLQPDGTNVPGPAGAPLRVCACPGERTRTTALLWSKSAFDGVTVSFGDLVGTQGAIPASSLSAKVVKVWYQGLGAPDTENTQSIDQVLVPELMLNDDALVIPDHDNCRNLVRLHEGGRTWYADADTITSASWAEAIPAAELPIADAATLQPFALRSREGKQLMIRIRVPEGAKAGAYAGTVAFAAGGRTLATLPVELTVLPFELPAATETVYDPSREYTMGLYLWANHAATDADVIAPFPRSRRQLMAEYASLLDNGVTSPTFVWTSGNLFDDDVFRENLTWIREAGFPGTKLHLGSSDNLGSDSSEAGILKVTNRVVRALATAKEFGFDEVYFYGQDEIKDPEVIANEVKVWRAVHAVGGKVMVSVVEKNRGDFAQCLDLCVHANQPEEIDTSAWHADGTLVWKYGTPQTYIENPRAYRRSYGLQIWKRGFDGANTYCDVGGSAVWNDVANIREWRESGGAKGGVGRGLTLYYPTEDGVVETLALTGLESAITDVRYLTKFRQLLRECPNPAAAAWFDALDPDRTDSEAMRKETVEWILRLDGSAAQGEKGLEGR